MLTLALPADVAFAVFQAKVTAVSVQALVMFFRSYSITTF